MSGVLRRLWSGTGGRAVLVATGVAAVVAAPLAGVGAGPASAVTIGGAQNITDTVKVDFASGTPTASTTSEVHVLAFNDFHGNLEPVSLNLYGDFAGGAAYLSKLIKDKRALYGKESVATVYAGDNIGASPLASALFKEEPAIIVSNLMGVDFASVGNHEFDKGSAELLRIQKGGCGSDNCAGAPYVLPHGKTTSVYPGARFTYLSSNVTVTATGRTLFPSFGVSELEPVSGKGKDVKVGFIGSVLQGTPGIVTPSGVAGLTFSDEAEAANKAAARLRKQGVKIPVLVIHQGGFQTTPPAITAPNGCQGSLAGSDIEKIVTKLDPSIKVIISGHTHAEYRCTITVNGVTRLVTSASSFGRVLSDLTLTVDRRTGELVSATATNEVVKNALNKPGAGVVRQADPAKEDPVVKAVVDEYVAKSGPLANKVIGRIQGDLLRAQNTLGESTLGNVIADSQLAATAPAPGGAQIAFMNIGGIRTDLKVTDISPGGEAPGEVTYGEAFAVQPFGNSLVTKTMTGDQIRRVLQQQFVGCGGQGTRRIMQISSTLTYEQGPVPATSADCAAAIGVIKINGVVVNPTDTFRVTMNSFLATGGDGFGVFNEGTDAVGGDVDIDAQVAAFAAAGTTGIAVPALGRITAKP